ncbi:Elongation factor Ts, mitochondrial [Coemansia sp. RSA 1813]|nr:Elongation factor Ts, mitochondrial [Coemansia sp. RSA 1843]KAJ2087671.1 Elongation factor Ts, mitochondrial [Coemansia sp. RSA 986]KAJ2567036.1 Elongation factor Ts, mitochondrial [Coemansia sp. RSA 1813]
MTALRRAGASSVRAYATKVDIKALKRLREINPVSITKAKEALISVGNDIEKAVEWLDKDALTSGAKKAEKVKDRAAIEGAIAVHISEDLTVASIVEIGCETDFVARNAMFVELASAIARSAMEQSPKSDRNGVLANIETEELATKMLDNHNVADTITETIGRLGENIVLRRGKTVGSPGAVDSIVVSGYVHGGVSGSSGVSTGKIGGLVAVRSSICNSQHRHALNQLTKRLAQQVVGYAPRYATIAEWERARTSGVENGNEGPEVVVLEAQQFLFGGGTIGEVLAKVSNEIGAPVEIASFVRFERGEGIEKPAKPDFAEEIRQQLA